MMQLDLPFGDPQTYRVDIIEESINGINVGTLLIKVYGTDSEEIVFLGRCSNRIVESEGPEISSFLCERLV